MRHAPKRPRVGKRTILACIECKRKKLKCNGQTPKCNHCLKNQHECLVEDPATGLRRPRDYMQSLESRVVYLEALLRESRPDIPLNGDNQHELRDIESNTPFVPTTSAQAPEAPTSSQLQDSPGAYTSPSYMQEASSSSSIPKEHAGQVDHLSSEVALLCLNAAGGEPHYFGPSSAVLFSRIISATMGLKSEKSSSSPRTFEGSERSHPNARPDRVPGLPSPSVAANLSRAYFDNIHPQYPFLHRPTFCKWELDVCKSSQSVHNPAAGEVPLFFVLMVYATGSLVLNQSQHGAAAMYYSMALDYLPSVLALNNLESIQSILCCAVYSIRSPTGASLWKISGMAIRHCIELGYHRSAERYRKHVDPLTKEMSRRCFWVAYDIDRVAAFTLGRPMGIPDELIDAELPMDIEDENITPSGLLANPRATGNQVPTIMTGTLHVIKLRKLWAKFHATLYSPQLQYASTGSQFATVDTLRQELEEWHASAPTHLDYSSSHPLSVFASNEWFQIAYNHSILILYRSHITRILGERQGSGPNESNSTDFIEEEEDLQRAFENCSRCAREICVLYRRLYQKSSVQFTWGSLHILFLGGLTYLYCLWRSWRIRQQTKQSEILKTCMACTTVLVIIAERWNLATSYRDIFETLSEKTINMICGNDKLAGPAPPQSQWTAPYDNLLSPRDWSLGFDDLSMPQGSDWFIQEFLQQFPES
ncbi:transcriptional regulator family: Fungal Specific TF [Penicillium roqueforti]|uniref:Zn(2)-C6 fungal-type DNA-binding domain n=1 Tax=Penicillium roqueforti (strain FM164) TaxID=1365484 RepID=W6QKC4_PENRF|nr:transcriptional regulator family: Fungal Specific TF [Penicillium roqueforti]CDM36875.1 Zn(2)-C6 fungal-type DNA-binding domain [Penicillium roqueforti FM164]KAF9250038.1 transcriptional regulator family: Fungal Specific TF [Penicillium roqueforti]KAI2679489.1 transcriptional regulator family: Fungal Specific TF [Penicillium roqueforti]KAI2684569.1 transcriptional regulator family: Fungal Specific TF [Penicillium roqueforti]KAI2701119.1 transcriptional regulator family: Fungal Specific TF [